MQRGNSVLLRSVFSAAVDRAWQEQGRERRTRRLADIRFDPSILRGRRAPLGVSSFRGCRLSNLCPNVSMPEANGLDPSAVRCPRDRQGEPAAMDENRVAVSINEVRGTAKRRLASLSAMPGCRAAARPASPSAGFRIMRHYASRCPRHRPACACRVVARGSVGKPRSPSRSPAQRSRIRPFAALGHILSG